MDNLSISIVNYNGGEYLIKCLKSIQKIRDEARISVYLVDNASFDGSMEDVKKEKLADHIIENKENLGFGKAHNQVLKIVKDENILLLNPDTELKKGVISTMLKFMEENKDVGAATCKILLPDGSMDWASHRGFPTPAASILYFLGNDSLYHLSNKNLEKTHEVDAISGAFFLTRKSVLEKVGPSTGGFDEDYFMYAEDIDLCFRIKEKGFKVMYVPEVEIIHHKGVSSGLKKHSQTITSADLETKKRSLGAFYKTMKIFYKKHYENSYPFFVNRLIYLAINIKWMMAKRKLVV